MQISREGPNYSVSNGVVTMSGGRDGYYDAIVVSTKVLNRKRLSQWDVKIHSMKNSAVMIGVVPADIDQSVNWFDNRCGWFISVFQGYYFSGPPQNHYNSQTIHSGIKVSPGAIIRVQHDPLLRTITFIVGGVPVSPCIVGVQGTTLSPAVLLANRGDCVEFLSSHSRNKAPNE